MNYIAKFKMTALLAATPLLTFAHTGHGVAKGASMIHYLLSPMHAIPVGLGILAVGLYFWRKKQTASK